MKGKKPQKPPIRLRMNITVVRLPRQCGKGRVGIMVTESNICETDEDVGLSNETYTGKTFNEAFTKLVIDIEMIENRYHKEADHEK